MKYKNFKDRFVIRLDPGDEIMKTMTDFCNEFKIRAGYFSGIGATNKVKIDFFDIPKKKYVSKEYDDDFEIASLYGNIATLNGKSMIHAHISIADRQNSVFGGHLSSAKVSVTCEIILHTLDGEIEREKDKVTGLNLIEI